MSSQNIKQQTQIPTVAKTSAEHPLKQIHFVVSARDLPKTDRGILGSTVKDPYIKWSYSDKYTEEFVEGGVTSHRKNDQNPEWYDNVFLYHSNLRMGQVWRFEVFDHDCLSKDDRIGSVDINVQEFVQRTSALDKKAEVSLKLSCGGTILITRCEPVRIRLSATDLPRLDPLNGLSDPHVKCYWSFEKDGPKTLFATTKTIKNVENAEWLEEIEFNNYMNHAKQYWTFKVFDKDPLPTDDFIGEATVEVDNFVRNKGNGASAVFNLSKDCSNKAKLFITPS